MRISFSEAASLALATICLCIVGMNVYASFASLSPYLKHDEAEHLSVIFSLLRGDVPYQDFIENHPALPHAFMAGIAQRFSITEPMTILAIGRCVLAMAFIGSIFITSLFIRQFSAELGINHSSYILVAIPLALSGVWTYSKEWTWGHESLWEFRPDWLCFFFAASSVYAHFRGTTTQAERHRLYWVITGGVIGGVASAILAKSLLIFLPYALTYALIALAFPGILSARIFKPNDHFIRLTLVYAFAGILAFFASVAWEIWTTHETFQNYYLANFRLNSIKHLILSNDDWNPFNIIRSIAGLGLTSFLLGFLWYFSEIFSAHRAQNIGRLGYLLAPGLVIGINMALPAFTNGQSWPQYYAPSILALVLLSALMTDRLLEFFSRKIESYPGLDLLRSKTPCLSPKIFTVLKWSISLIVIMLVLQRLDSRIYETELRFSDIEISDLAREKHFGSTHWQTTPDAFLPDNLTYLTFSPAQKPSRSAAWG